MLTKTIQANLLMEVWQSSPFAWWICFQYYLPWDLPRTPTGCLLWPEWRTLPSTEEWVACVRSWRVSPAVWRIRIWRTTSVCLAHSTKHAGLHRMPPAQGVLHSTETDSASSSVTWTPPETSIERSWEQHPFYLQICLCGLMNSRISVKWYNTKTPSHFFFHKVSQLCLTSVDMTP